MQNLNIKGAVNEADSDQNQRGRRPAGQFAGGNQDALKYVLDRIAPYCDSEELLYQNLRDGNKV